MSGAQVREPDLLVTEGQVQVATLAKLAELDTDLRKHRLTYQQTVCKF
jgi:hypothetical protein